MKSAIMLGTELDDLVKQQLDVTDSITDTNSGMSLSQLEQPLEHLIEIHRLWVQTVGKEGRQLDLSGYDLHSLKELRQEHLTGIRACNARFFGMDLYQIELQSAALDGANFQQCDMEDADLRGSSFKGANFNHVNLRNANFNPLLFGEQGTESERLQPCDLEGSSLRYADLREGKLKRANLRHADLSYADLSRCDLRYADFSGAKLDNTIFEGADIKYAVFDEDQVKDLKRRNIPIGEYE